jgi:hypothetical protein
VGMLNTFVQPPAAMSHTVDATLPEASEMV